MDSMTIKEAVELYNKINTQIDVAAKLGNELTTARLEADKDPWGRILITKDQYQIIKEIIDRYICSRRARLNETFDMKGE